MTQTTKHRICSDLDAAHNAVRTVAHRNHIPRDAKIALELAGAHLRAAWRITAHGKADPSDDPDAIHKAVTAFFRMEEYLRTNRTAQPKGTQ